MGLGWERNGFLSPAHSQSCCPGSVCRSWYYCLVLGYLCLGTWFFPVDLYINPVPSPSPGPFLLLSPFQSTDSQSGFVLACKSSPKQLFSVSRNSLCGCGEPSSIHPCWCTFTWPCTCCDALDGACSIPAKRGSSWMGHCM